MDPYVYQWVLMGNDESLWVLIGSNGYWRVLKGYLLILMGTNKTLRVPKCTIGSKLASGHFVT
jgi:hypothetical protein